MRKFGMFGLIGTGLVSLTSCVHNGGSDRANVIHQDRTSPVYSADFLSRYENTMKKIESGKDSGTIGDKDFRLYSDLIVSLKEKGMPEKERMYFLNEIDGFLNHYELAYGGGAIQDLENLSGILEKVTEETRIIAGQSGQAVNSPDKTKDGPDN